MKYGNSVSGRYDDSRFTTIEQIAISRARETGEDINTLISVLMAKNPNIKQDQEVTEMSVNLPNDWYGFYNEETGVGDFYTGMGRTQAQKGQIPEEVREYNKAKLDLMLSRGGVDGLSKSWKFIKAWFNKTF